MERINCISLWSQRAFIESAGAHRTWWTRCSPAGGDLTVLDIAAPALDAARARLGADAERVRWQVATSRNGSPRAAMPCGMTARCSTSLPSRRSARPIAAPSPRAPPKGALAIVATFALAGPERCSGLPVEHYDADKLAGEIGPPFSLLESWREEHVTP
jgi:hypothetical protein